MIAVINYGVGNLHSVQKAIAYVGGDVVVTDDAQEILGADKVVFPGVGAFADGMEGLRSRNLVQVVKDAARQGKLLLGICLGMQLLFEISEEQGCHQGLGLLPGKVVFFRETDIKVPQIGWNQVQVESDSPLLKSIETGDYYYFNHSYYCVPDDERDVFLVTTYGTRFASAVGRDNIFGVQFHPEKSQKTGLQLLKNFVEL